MTYNVLSGTLSLYTTTLLLNFAAGGWCMCRGVTTPTPFVDFSERSLYRARIAFLWGPMGISKNEFSSTISAPIGVKFCTRSEGNNTQNRVRANFKFPPLKNLAPL